MKLKLSALPLVVAIVSIAASATPSSASIISNIVTEPGFGTVDLDTVGSADWWWVNESTNTTSERAASDIFDTSSLVISQFTNAGPVKWTGQSGGLTIGNDNHVQGPGNGGPITFELTPDVVGEYTLNLYATNNPAGNSVTGTFDGVASNTITAGNLLGILYTVEFEIAAGDVGTAIEVGIGRTGSGQIRLQGATLSVVPVAVPEPSSIALLFGLGGLTALRRRR